MKYLYFFQKAVGFSEHISFSTCLLRCRLFCWPYGSFRCLSILITDFKFLNSYILFSFCWIVMVICTIVEICGVETKGRNFLIPWTTFSFPCRIFNVWETNEICIVSFRSPCWDIRFDSCKKRSTKYTYIWYFWKTKHHV